jgi:cytochrome c-type biogenesis protein CcmH/NrfF
MSVLWVVPLIVLAAGAVLVGATLRRSTEATVGLRNECAQLEELRSALVDLRREADSTRAAVDRIRSRPERTQVPR